MRKIFNKMAWLVNGWLIITLVLSSPAFAATATLTPKMTVAKPPSSPVIMYTDSANTADFAKAIEATRGTAASVLAAKSAAVDQAKPATIAPIGSPITAASPANQVNSPPQLPPANGIRIAPIPKIASSDIGGTLKGLLPSTDLVVWSAPEVSEAFRIQLGNELFRIGDYMLTANAERADHYLNGHGLPSMCLNTEHLSVQANLAAHAMMCAIKLQSRYYDAKKRLPDGKGTKIVRDCRFVPDIRHSSQLEPGEYYRYGWTWNQTYPVIVISDELYWQWTGDSLPPENLRYIATVLINHSYLYSALSFGFIRDFLETKNRADVASLLMQNYFSKCGGLSLDFFGQLPADIKKFFSWLPRSQELPIIQQDKPVSMWAFDWFLHYAYYDLVLNPQTSSYKDCDPKFAKIWDTKRHLLEVNYWTVTPYWQDWTLSRGLYDLKDTEYAFDMTTSNSYVRLLYPPIPPIPSGKKPKLFNACATKGSLSIANYAEPYDQKAAPPDEEHALVEEPVAASVACLGAAYVITKALIATGVMALLDGAVIRSATTTAAGEALAVGEAASVASAAAEGGTAVISLSARALALKAAQKAVAIAGSEQAKAAVFLLISLAQLGNVHAAQTGNLPDEPGAFTRTADSFRLPGLGEGNLAMSLNGQGFPYSPSVGLVWRYGYMLPDACDFGTHFSYHGPATLLNSNEMARMLAVPKCVKATFAARAQAIPPDPPYMGMTNVNQIMQQHTLANFFQTMDDYIGAVSNGSINVAWLTIDHTYEGWMVPDAGFSYLPNYTIYLNRDMQELITREYDPNSGEYLPARYPPGGGPFTPPIQGYLGPGLACYYQYMRLMLDLLQPKLSEEKKDLKAMFYTLLALSCYSDDQLGYELGTIVNGVPKAIPGSWTPFELGNMLPTRIAFQTLFFDNDVHTLELSTQRVIDACRLARLLCVTGTLPDSRAMTDAELLALMMPVY